MGDTILAVASPPGQGARAIVRVSGPRALDLPGVHAAANIRAGPSASADAIASARAGEPSGGLPRRRGCLAVRIKVDDRRACPALGIIYAAPASYTGEDALELLLPGQPHLVARVVDRLLGPLEPRSPSASGAPRAGDIRRAEPGEFTARAYLNGKLTLAQAEGVAATIAAQHEQQLAAARELLDGRAGERYRAWADELVSMLALVEAGIDFTDQEDVVPIARTELASRAAALARALDEHAGSARGGAHADALPRVALVGAPNAGKSTLFNALLGRRRAVVADLAGTTRDVIEEPLDLSAAHPGAGAVMLCDLAGLDGGPLAPGSSAALAQRAAADAIVRADVLVLCDARARFDVPGLPAGRPTIRVRTKADLPAPPGLELAGVIEVGALDGYHLSALKAAIADAAGTSRHAGIAALLPRHRAAIDTAARALNELVWLLGDRDEPAVAREVRASSEAVSDPALAAELLRRALDAIGELAGRVSPDDVLGRVFAAFCVGK